MKKLAKETWHALGQNWKNVLLFEVLYRGIMLPVYLQLTNRTLQTALRIAGYSYLTADNIGSFLMKPVTWSVGLLIMIVGILLQALEMAGLITAFQGAAYSHKLSPLHILWGGIQKLDEAAARKNFRLIFLMLVVSFLGRGIYAVGLLYHMKPWNVLLQRLITEPLMWVILLLLLTASAIIAVKTMFVFPVCMIEQKTFKEAMQRSRELLHKHMRKAIGHLINCQVVVLGMIAVCYGISVLLLSTYAVLFAEENLVTVTVYLWAERLKMTWLFIGSVVTMVVYYAALTIMFYQYANRRYHVPGWRLVYPAKGTAARKRLAELLFIVTAAAAAIVVDFEKHGSTISGDMMTDIQVIAHRGSTRNAPENTLSAIKTAVGEMADCVEIDVQMTKDGVVVLSNDANLRRVAGVNRSINNMTLEEVRQLDAGSSFSPEFAGEMIPTLEEVLQFCKGNVNLNIEIKQTRTDSELPDRVVEMIQAQGMEKQCVVTSTSMSHLMRVKELEPKLHTGYMVSAAYGGFDPGRQVDFISVRHEYADEELVRHIHEQGKRVYVWNVNVPAELKRLKTVGVDGVITDRPVMVRETLYQNKRLEWLTNRLKQVFR
ncbi:MAG: glycerophosphodiester phosphodiesterase family protein [Brotaphodocola sp.]